MQFLTSLSIELHIETRASLQPDPEFDPILAVFYFIHNDWPLPSGEGSGCHGDGCGSHGDNTELGVIAIDIDNAGFKRCHTGKPSPLKPESGQSQEGKTSTSHSTRNSPSPLKSPVALSPSPAAPSIGSSPQIQRFLDGCGLEANLKVTYVSSELELFEKLVELVRQVDPDFLIGYEVTMASWGYLIERAAALNVNLTNEISRIPSESITCCTRCVLRLCHCYFAQMLANRITVFVLMTANGRL